MVLGKKRHLTDEEMNDILSGLPEIIAGTEEVSKKLRKEISSVQKLHLRDFSVHEEIIPHLKKWYINQARRSTIQPGSAIGMITASAIGAPMTQLNLNTFHQAGSAKSVGIDAFKELFNGTAVRKEESTNLHFRDKNLSFEEVLEYRRTIVGVSIGAVTLSTEVKKWDSSHSEWWYGLYEDVVKKGRKINKSKYYVRMYLNKNALYKYKITMNDIVNKLENDSSGDVQTLSCVPSPIEMGIIDVFTVDQVIQDTIKSNISSEDYAGINEQNASIIYLQQIFIPSLNTLTIKGVPNIISLSPVSIPTISIIRTEEQLESKSDEWLLWLDNIRIRTSGLPLTKLFTLLEELDVIVLNKKENVSLSITGNERVDEKEYLTEESNGKYLHIRMSNEWSRKNPKNLIEKWEIENKNLLLHTKDVNNLLTLLDNYNINVISQTERIITISPPKGMKGNIVNYLSDKYTPLNLINKRISEEQEKMKLWKEEEKEKGVIYPIYPYTKFYRSSQYVYAELVGSNLKMLVSLDFVDSSRTLSNSPFEILLTFGVETCRNYIALNFYEMLKANMAYINPKYIYLIADFMTNQGVIIAITSKGITKFGRGAFADASFQEPLTHFMRAAVSGRKEPVTSTSACIFFGKRMPIGTGMPKLELDNTVIDSLKEVDVSEFLIDNLRDIDNKDNLVVVNDDIIHGNEEEFDKNVQEIVGKVTGVTVKGGDMLHLKSVKGVGPKGPVPVVKQCIFTLPPTLFAALTLIEEEENTYIPSMKGITANDLLNNVTQGLLRNMKEGERKVEMINENDFVDQILDFI
jgi:DNA-directed RNA polymerase beta' subunit